MTRKDATLLALMLFASSQLAFGQSPARDSGTPAATPPPVFRSKVTQLKSLCELYQKWHRDRSVAMRGLATPGDGRLRPRRALASWRPASSVRRHMAVSEEARARRSPASPPAAEWYSSWTRLDGHLAVRPSALAGQACRTSQTAFADRVPLESINRPGS